MNRDLGVTAPNLHASKGMANKPAPPSSMCRVHAQGVKSWGDRFIRVEFCVAYSSHEFVFPLEGSACVDQCVLLTSAEVSRKF